MLIKLIKKSKIIFTLGVCLLPLLVRAAPPTEKPHLIERRLVFDVGSNNTKAQVSDFDVTDQKIVRTVASFREKVYYQADLEKRGDGRFSREIMEKGVAAFEAILKKAEPYKPQKSLGMATAAYREALNGQEMCDLIYKRLGLRINVAPQDTESRLGFLTARSLFPDIDPKNLISWDIGGGSFQISGLVANGSDEPEFRVWKGAFAKIGMGLLMLQKVQGKVLDDRIAINPVSISDVKCAQELLEEKYIGQVPTWLKEKIQDPKTRMIGLGAMHGELARALENSTYTHTEAGRMIEKWAGSSDEDLKPFAGSPQFVIPNYIYLYTFMKLMNAEQVTRGVTTGNMNGILLHTPLWKSDK